MINSCTKETVSTVSKKQEASPPEQSLQNKDSLQTFCSHPIGFNTLFESLFKGNTSKESLGEYLQVTVTWDSLKSDSVRDKVKTNER